jgi:O-antigen/teichoic acid export membrane protein
MDNTVVISKRLILVNSLSSVAARVLNVFVLVWLQQYLLKRISPAEYSLYPVLASLMVFLPLFTLALTAGLGRYIVEAYAKGDQQRVTEIVSSVFVLLTAVVTAILVGGLLFAWNVHHVLTVDPAQVFNARVMMTLMVLAFVIRTVLTPFTLGLFVRQKFVLQNVIMLGNQLLRITVLFVLLFAVSTRVLWVVVSTVSAEMCALVVLAILSHRLVPALVFRRSRIRWAAAAQVTSFGGWSLLASLADMIRTSSDPIVLNKLATPYDVTCFYLGSLPYQEIQRFSSAAQEPLMPQLTAIHAAERKGSLTNAYLRGGRYGLWAALFLSVPLLIFSREFVTLWVGKGYLQAAVVVTLLMAICPFTYGQVMLTNIAIATAQIRSVAICAVLAQTLNLLLTLYLVGVRGMGAVGSALGTFLVMAIVWPIMNYPLGWRMGRVSAGRWLRETVLPGLVPALAGAIVWALLKLLVRPASWLSLALCVCAGLACYVAVLLCACLQKSDAQDLRRLLASFRIHRAER